MKSLITVFVVSIMLLSFSPVSSAATLGVGARATGMGGVGIATANDITAAYYNPAGMQRSGIFDGKLSFGYAMNDLDVLVDALSSAGDPITFADKFYDKNVDSSGQALGIAGFQINKMIGISVVPTARVVANKAANTVDSTFIGRGGYTGIITLGHTLDIPGLPFSSLAIGGNIKLITDASGNASISGAVPPAPVTTEATLSTGSGVGFDLGAQGEIDIPGFSTVSVGIVLKNVLETINYNDKTVQYLVETGPPDPGKATITGESETTRSYVSPMIIGVGASTTIPVFGTLIASDITMVGGDDGETSMSFGAEQPVLGIAVLRVGMSTGSESSVSFGGGIRAGVNFDIAYVIDSEDTRANAVVFELGAAF